MLTNYLMGYLFESDIEILLIVFKMVISAQKELVQTWPRLPFHVGHFVCLGPTEDANVA